MDQTGFDAKVIKVKMNIFRSGGSVILQGCAEGCPSDLLVNKKTVFKVNGKKIKRKNIKKYSGRSGFLNFNITTKSVTHIDWK